MPPSNSSRSSIFIGLKNSGNVIEALTAAPKSPFDKVSASSESISAAIHLKGMKRLSKFWFDAADASAKRLIKVKSISVVGTKLVGRILVRGGV